MHPSEGRVLTNPLLWVVSREAGIRVGRRLECARSRSLGGRAFSSRGAASTSEGKWHVLHVGVKAPGIPTKSDMPLEPPITSASFICRPSALTSTIASGSMSPGWISCDTSFTCGATVYALVCVLRRTTAVCPPRQAALLRLKYARYAGGGCAPCAAALYGFPFQHRLTRLSSAGTGRRAFPPEPLRPSWRVAACACLRSWRRGAAVRFSCRRCRGGAKRRVDDADSLFCD